MWLNILLLVVGGYLLSTIHGQIRTLLKLDFISKFSSFLYLIFILQSRENSL